MNTTITLARQHGAGAILRAADGTRYKVRDFSPGTGDVYGYGYPDAGEYRQLPADLIAVVSVEELRREVFRHLPILRDYCATMLQDLQYSEADEACEEGREERDAGTIYTIPDATFAACRQLCERFMADNVEHVAAAIDLEPGEEGIRYANGRYMTEERIGSTLWLAVTGSGVTFTDDGDAPCLVAMADWARRQHVEAYLGDDGYAYVVGRELESKEKTFYRMADSISC